MGGGVAMLDYDNDGHLDLFVVNGGKTRSADFGRGDPAYWNRLYKQNVNGSHLEKGQAGDLLGVALLESRRAREAFPRGT